MTDTRLVRLRAPDESLNVAGYAKALRKMADVIGALLMREMHTRFGRDNVGYLWLFLEPMMLGTVIGLFHLHSGGNEGHGVTAIALTVTGYTNFIMFRGIVNRAEGGLESNAPLLYHRQVTVLDIVLAKGLMEAAGTLMAYTFLMSILILIGQATLPVRPLYIFAGIGYVFTFSLGVSMLVMAGAYEIRTVERLVHVFTYFMVPLSGAFYMLRWMPAGLRDILVWIPLPTMFEMIRYGQFESASYKYINFEYASGWCLAVNFAGLVAVKGVRKRVHLN